jgi:broad specificity phosphatase PhoE
MLYIVRHGQTDWNAFGRIQGHAPIPLNSEGRAEARRAALWLRGRRISAFYTSDLRRAVETAKIISSSIRAGWAPEPRLREANAGIWTGCNATIIAGKSPIDWQDWHTGRYRPTGGESILHLQRRAIAAVNDIRKRHANTDILLVTHLGVIRVLFAHITHRTVSAASKLCELRTGSIMVLDDDYDGRFRAVTEARLRPRLESRLRG